MASFHFNIEPPKNGWLRLRAQTKGDSIDLDASYTPYDTLAELVDAIGNIHENHRPQEIRVNEEPEESILQLSKDGTTSSFMAFVSITPPRHASK